MPVKNGILIAAIALGASAGAFASRGDDFGPTLVMITIGVVAGAAIGGSLSRLVRRTAFHHQMRTESVFPPDDRMNTYWRDKGEIYPMPGHPDPEGARRELP